MALVPVVPYTSTTFNPSAWDTEQDVVTFADLAKYAPLSAPSFVNGIQVSGLTHALGDFTVDGFTIFSLEIPTTALVWNPSAPYITNANQFITKAFADATYNTIAGDVTAAGANAFTGTNTFNTNLPTSTLTPTTGTQLITKAFADATYNTIAGDVTAAGANAFTGTNTFNTNLPTSTQTPTTSTQLITKAYADATYGGGSANVFPTANLYNSGVSGLGITVGNVAVSVGSPAASWNILDFFAVRFTIFVQYGYYPGGSGTTPSWKYFESFIGTMNIYPNRALVNWGVNTTYPNYAPIDNNINGVSNFFYADYQTWGSNPSIPDGRPYFTDGLIYGGNAKSVFMCGNGTAGNVVFNIENPNGTSSGLPYTVQISLELVSTGRHSDTISTSGFDTNFSA